MTGQEVVGSGANQENPAIDTLAGKLKRALEIVTDPNKYQTAWVQASTDPYRLGEQYKVIESAVSECLRGAPEGITQEAVTKFFEDLLDRQLIKRTGGRTAASLFLSAIMRHTGVKHLDVPAEIFLPTTNNYSQGFKGERTLGYGLSKESTVNLVTGYDPERTLTAEQIADAIKPKDDAKEPKVEVQFQINGINIEESLPKPEPVAPARAEVLVAEDPTTNSQKNYYLLIPVDPEARTSEVLKTVHALHESLAKMETNLQQELVTLLTNASSGSDVAGARGYLCSKFSRELKFTEGSDLSEQQKSALDIFSQETIIRANINEALTKLVEEDIFASQADALDRSKQIAEELLNGLDGKAIEGGVRAFLEIDAEAITTRPAHSDGERHVKNALAGFISPLIAMAYGNNPELVVFEINFGRYHDKPKVSISSFGVGLEDVLDTQDKNGKHILIKGTDSSHVSAIRGIGKGVQYAA